MLLNKTQSLLCLDLGSKRIGIAGCDPLGITVSSLPPLLRSTFKKDVEYLKEICKNRKVKGLIIGLPLNENGLETSQSRYCIKLGSKIASSLSLPLAWVNEHSSSWEAEEKFNLKGDRSGALDSATAVVLLEQWLQEGSKIKLQT